MTKQQCEEFNAVLLGGKNVTSENIDALETATAGLVRWLNDNSILCETDLYFKYSGYLQTMRAKIIEYNDSLRNI